MILRFGGGLTNWNFRNLKISFQNKYELPFWVLQLSALDYYSTIGTPLTCDRWVSCDSEIGLLWPNCTHYALSYNFVNHDQFQNPILPQIAQQAHPYFKCDYGHAFFSSNTCRGITHTHTHSHTPGVFAGMMGLLPVAMRMCLAFSTLSPTFTSLGPVNLA